MGALNYAIWGIGSIAVMPLAFTVVSGLLKYRRERRRQAMLDRHASRWL